MAKIAGREVSKNTMVSVSFGAIFSAIFGLWMLSGIGRPLFAADLERIEDKIDGYQTVTSIQILGIRKAALKTELRNAKRDVRRNPDDDDAADDIDEIKSDIEDINNMIVCHRTEGCEVKVGL